MGTCIVVPEFGVGSVADEVLSLDGELVMHLRRIASPDVPDSSAYIRATASPFFPSSYPEPPEEELGSAALQKELLATFCGSVVMREELPDLTVDWYVQRQETPGPRAVQLRRRTLLELLGRRSSSKGLAVCEKTDGTRSFLFVPALQPSERRSKRKAFFIDRGWAPTALDPALAERLSPGGGATLLDGEVTNLLPGTGGAPGRLAYVIFDAVFLDGVDLGSRPLLSSRMQAVEEVLDSAVAEGGLHGSSAAGAFQLLAKRFHSLEDLDKVIGCMETQGGDRPEYIFDDGQRRSKSDGLVFTPSSVPYYMYQVRSDLAVEAFRTIQG